MGATIINGGRSKEGQKMVSFAVAVFVFDFETKSNIICSLCLGGQQGGLDLGQTCQKAAGPGLHRGEI